MLGADFLTIRKQIPGIIFALWQGGNCLLTSTPDVLSRKNTHYKDGDMECVTDVLGFVFKYNACAEELPYQKSVLVAKEKHLFPRPIKKCIVEEQTYGKLSVNGKVVSDIKLMTSQDKTVLTKNGEQKNTRGTWSARSLPSSSARSRPLGPTATACMWTTSTPPAPRRPKC